MSRRFRLIAVLMPALVVLSLAQSLPPTSAPLVVHEWGTFTSIAGVDGRAVDWLPLDGSSDLPCFIKRFAFNLKGTLPGTVRMETPVLYFYGPAGMALSVNVRFQHGMMTEWFPPAVVTPSRTAVGLASLYRPEFSSGISWTDVTLGSATSAATFPKEPAKSHYYAARSTDASPLQSGDAREKFLFYRGVGGFQPPIAASVARNGQVIVKSTNGEALGDIVLFENRRGAMAYQVRSSVKDQISLDPPSVDGEYAAPLVELERILVANGLFPKEAKAMVETWRDSWFEEGTRLFYIAPRSAIDAVLPLTINPVPAQIVRVFVGRIELETESRTREIEKALRERDWVTLGAYGRFLEPILRRMFADSTAPARREMESALAVVGARFAPSRTCD